MRRVGLQPELCADHRHRSGRSLTLLDGIPDECQDATKTASST